MGDIMSLLQDWREPGVYGRWGINTGEGRAEAVGIGAYGPVFEGKHGFQQAFVDPVTGTYRRDNKGNVQTWTLPVTSGQMVAHGGSVVMSYASAVGSRVQTITDCMRSRFSHNDISPVHGQSVVPEIANTVDVPDIVTNIIRVNNVNDVAKKNDYAILGGDGVGISPFPLTTDGNNIVANYGSGDMESCLMSLIVAGVVGFFVASVVIRLRKV